MRVTFNTDEQIHATELSDLITTIGSYMVDNVSVELIEAPSTFLVCHSCGEAFDSIETATMHSSGVYYCIGLGYDLRSESDAF